MRITDKIIYNRAMRGMSQSAQRLSKTHVRIATTKNISTPSDDPIGSSKIMANYKDLYKVRQTIRNCDNANTLLSYTDTLLENVGEMLIDARNKASVMASDTVGKDARKIIAGEVGIMIDQMLLLANSQFAGRYIFGGHEISAAPYSKNVASDKVRYTSDNVNTYFTGKLDSTASTETQYIKPITVFDASGNSQTINITFAKTSASDWTWTSDQGTVTGTALTFDTNGTITGGSSGNIIFSGWGNAGADLQVNIDFSRLKQIAGSSSMELYAPINSDNVEYLGDEGEISQRVELGDEAMVINFPGSKVFGQGTADDGIFKVFKDLKDALESNNATDISGSLGKIDNQLDRLGMVRGETGVKVARILSSISGMNSLEISLKVDISQIEDVDMAEAAGELINNQEAYQAVLQTTATILKLPKLSDYL
jgi:flagellar hook-associated protein 3